jgi:hypothetical protein
MGGMGRTVVLEVFWEERVAQIGGSTEVVGVRLVKE